MNRRTYPLMFAVLLSALLVGCATSRPDIRINYEPEADFGAYSTFGFPEQTGADRGGYSTLVSDYFKSAVRQQMELRGYRYVEEDPELLVNFYANARERTEVRAAPTTRGGAGYYGYRYGLYGAWPRYPYDVETVTYPVGTANVDIVDARRKQLIWEGLAHGRISQEDMDNPREAITTVVTQLFTRFPGRAGAVGADR